MGRPKSSPPRAVNANSISATSRAQLKLPETPATPPSRLCCRRITARSVQALVEENNELLIRVQQRARQNHLLLSHAVELMQHLINSDFSRRKTEDLRRRGPAAVESLAAATALRSRGMT